MPIERFRGGPFDQQDRQVDWEITEEWILWSVDPANPADSETALYHLEETDEGKVYVFKGYANLRK